MATVRNTLGDSYIQITSTDYALIQNAGTSLMRVVFAASMPDDDTLNYHPVAHKQSIEKCGGFPTGDAYARMDDPLKEGYAVVSE